MKLGMVGLGRMGGNMTKRLERDGHEVATYARSGGTAASLEELVGQLEPRRAVWLMIPAGDPTEQAVRTLTGLLEPGDIIVDGGNSNFRDSQRRAALAREHRIGYVDAGVSGGIWGLENGYCLMVGGERDDIEQLEPAFRTLAPDDGYAHVGPSGAGHFVKMVHNGIEYGMMAALAEGLNVLAKADIGAERHADDAETAPLEDAKYFQFDFDLGKVTEVWRRGSVISSWLLDLTAIALNEDPALEAFQGRVSDSGEGRWTIQAAIEESVPVPVLSAALYERFTSRGEALFADKVLSAMRKQFGGHAEKPSG
jgi:6-phosphogluconate dehydrogenase